MLGARGLSEAGSGLWSLNVSIAGNNCHRQTRPDGPKLSKGSGPNFPAPHLTNPRCEAPLCPLHKAPRPLFSSGTGWLGVACMGIKEHCTHALRHVLKHMCSPSELLGASHLHPTPPPLPQKPQVIEVPSNIADTMQNLNAGFVARLF